MILLVEDDRSTRTLERFVLEKEGYSVVAAGSGEEALEVLTGSSPDLVLLDIRLPGIDGFTTFQTPGESWRTIRDPRASEKGLT